MSSRKPLEKIKKQRIYRTKVIILGDGETEKSYIDRLKKLGYFKNSSVEFIIGDEHNYNIKLKEHLHVENIYLILDIDNIDKNSSRYEKIKRLIKDKKYKVYYNNYSFETWLINHKKCFSKPITSKTSYDLEMNRNFKVSSWSRKKNQANRKKIMTAIHLEDVERAQENVKVINENSWDENPSTNMDKFIEEIIKINKK